MNLASLPWEELIAARPAPSGVTLPSQARALDVFNVSAQRIARFSDTDHQAAARLLAALGIDAHHLLSRLGVMLGRAVGETAILSTCVREGMLDQAVTAARWDWHGVVGVDTTGLSMAYLKSVREHGQELLHWVANQAEAPTLAEIADHLGDDPRRGMILRWTTQNLSLVPGFCPRRKVPTLGRPSSSMDKPKASLLAPKQTKVSRPQAQQAPPLDQRPSRLDEDLSAVMAELAMQPARLRQDRTLHAVEQKRLSACLPADQVQPLAERLNRALLQAQTLGLIATSDQALQLVAEGQAWLRQGTGGRQRQVMGYLRGLLMGEAQAPLLRQRATFLYHYAVRYAAPRIDVMQAWQHLANIWRDLGSDTWLTQQALDWWAGRPPAELRSDLAKEWVELLEPALHGLAIPLGLIVTGRVAAGTGSTIRLTPAGRWALGLDEDWTPASEAVVERPIIVQADHSIVFLAKAPMLAAQINGFADRQTGTEGLGILFKLSKAACRRAAAEGIDATAALAVLEAAASKPVPANVARELSGWFGQVRQVQAYRVLLVTARDEETATRLLSVKGAVRVGPLAVSLPDSTKSDELKKRLLKDGILVTGRSGLMK